MTHTVYNINYTNALAEMWVVFYLFNSSKMFFKTFICLQEQSESVIMWASFYSYVDIYYINIYIYMRHVYDKYTHIHVYYTHKYVHICDIYTYIYTYITGNTDTHAPHTNTHTMLLEPHLKPKIWKKQISQVALWPSQIHHCMCSHLLPKTNTKIKKNIFRKKEREMRYHY